MQPDRLHWSAHIDLLFEYEKEDAPTKAGASASTVLCKVIQIILGLTAAEVEMEEETEDDDQGYNEAEYRQSECKQESFENEFHQRLVHLS